MYEIQQLKVWFGKLRINYIYIYIAGFHTGIISEGEGITEDCGKEKYHRRCEATNPPLTPHENV